MDGPLEFKMIVLTRRLRLPGLLETMTDQAPEMRNVMDKIVSDLAPTLVSLDGSGWKVNSHAVTVYNGLVVATFLVFRPATPLPSRESISQMKISATARETSTD